MPYIGTDINYGNLAKQTGTGDGADTTPIAALTYTVPSSESILVFLDGVCQVPSTDFTATGTTLTFTTAPANGVAILVMFLGRSLDIGTPADNTVDSAQLVNGSVDLAHMSVNSIDSDQYVDGSIDTAHIANNQVDETKLKDALIGDFSDVTVTAADTFLYGDATDSGNTKKDTVQGILDLTTGGIWTLIESITPSGTYVSFENKLTATYRTYMIIFEEASSGFSGANGEMHYGTGTSSITWKSSGYYSAGDYRDSNMAGTTVVDADNDSKFVWAALSGTGGGCAINGVMYIFSRVNDYVGYTFHYVNNFSTGYPGYGVSAGHTSLSSITSVRFSYAGTTWGTAGTPRVSLYGLTAT